jgi:hypothetical protein
MTMTDDYPAGKCGYGRRAREVMPAAMRALVRTSAAGGQVVMGAGLEHEFVQRASDEP